MTDFPNPEGESMSEQKHTPGKWRILQQREPSDGTNHLAIAAGDAPAVAVCRISDVRFANAEDEANARLIAAAPDLLAACKAAIEHLEQSAYDHSDASEN